MEQFARWFLPLVSVEVLPDMGATRGRRGDEVEIPQAFLEPRQSSKRELFLKIVNSFQPLTIFKKAFILDVWQGFEYAPYLILSSYLYEWLALYCKFDLKSKHFLTIFNQFFYFYFHSFIELKFVSGTNCVVIEYHSPRLYCFS